MWEGRAADEDSRLQHHARNLLGRIRSIVRRTARTSDNVQDLATHLEGRLDALTRLQGLSPRDDDGIGLDMLIAGELVAYRAREGGQFSLQGPIVRLTRRAAESLGLAFHELATNALKFGALSTPSGHVEVTWRVSEGGNDERLLLRWSERGGPEIPDMEARHRGFGTDVLTRALTYEIAASVELDFQPEGLTCTIALPAGGVWRVCPDEIST